MEVVGDFVGFDADEEGRTRSIAKRVVCGVGGIRGGRLRVGSCR